MPRTALGQAAKTEVVSTRVTKEVKAELIARYGSTTAALNALIASVVRR